MKQTLRLFGQLIIYSGFAAMLWYFSASPAYERVPPGSALIKLSFAHGADRTADCRERTYEELMELAPNMRAPMDCPRLRRDVAIRMKLDNEVVYDDLLAPTGIHGDGPSITYRRFPVPAGTFLLELGLRDSGRQEGYDYVSRKHISLKPGQSLAIDFHAGGTGFIFE